MIPPFSCAGYSSLLDPDDEETTDLCNAGTIQPMTWCHRPEELNHHQVTDIYTGCNRRNGPDFGRVFLMLNYTEKPQNTYIQS